jgi:hydrogenase/urease accessory protein HupE
MTRAQRGAAATLVALALLCSASPARAHGNANLGDFYSGLFQPFFHAEFLLGALAIALWSTQQKARAAGAICAGFAAGVAAGSVAALLGARPAAAAWGPRAAMLLVGPLVALRVPLPAAAGATLAVAAGFAQGNAATASELMQIVRPVLWMLGLTSGAGLLGAYANAATQRFPAFWLQVGVRIAGSWITAIGLLVTVMATRAR